MNRQVDDMRSEEMGTGCDTKEGLVAVVGLIDWIGNRIEQLTGVHREERVRPAPEAG